MRYVFDVHPVSKQKQISLAQMTLEAVPNDKK